MTDRLDKLIASRTSLSRKEVISEIRRGNVSVDGVVIRDNSAKFDPAVCSVTLCGKPIEQSQYIYIMQNKPLGVVSASEGEKEKNVIDILPPELYRKELFPAGRLDKASTGFVLITNDGDLAHKILSPKNHVEKEYIVEVDGLITDEVIDGFKEGLVLKSGEQFKCAKITVCDASSSKSSAIVVIREGKYHQIRRMFAKFGLTVTALHRVRIGGLCLDSNLALGESKRLTDEEVQKLQKRD